MSNNAPVSPSQPKISETRHTATPWYYYSDCIFSETPQGEFKTTCVAYVGDEMRHSGGLQYGPERDANAALIVEAVNSCEAMKRRIAELEALVKLQGQEIQITRERDEKLEAALRPFSDIAQFITETQRDTRPIVFGMDNVVAQRLTIGHLRAARAALHPGTPAVSR